MRIDPENKTVHGASVFILFVLLNLTYLVTCIPLVTIGMATSSLFEVTMRYAAEEDEGLLSGYLRALGRNAKRGTLVFLCLIMPALLLLFSGVFWLAHGGAVSLLIAVFAFIGTLYLFATFVYGMALIAGYDAPLRQTLKNAMLLPIVEPWRTFVLVIVPATLVSLTAVLPMFIVIMVTVAFSVGSYATGFLLRAVFARH